MHPPVAEQAPAGDEPPGPLAIRAENLAKLYEIYAKPWHRVLDAVLPGKKRYEEFWAIRDVNLAIERGRTVGVIGENGAGKSTLLKLLSGITTPTRGSVEVHGRITSLIELGAGFHPEFSGRENIVLACSLLGLSDDEIAERTEPIIEFSELGKFIERPVKTYSSGMYVRLGFSVATCVDPEILLVDEALSVGDEHFRGKCMNRLNEFQERGGTTLFVSHDLGAVKQMCQEVILLDQGEIVGQGSSEKVAHEYLKRAHARGNDKLREGGKRDDTFPRWGTGEIEIEDVELIDAKGERSRVYRTGEELTVRMRYRARGACRQPVFGLGVYRADSTYVNGSNHDWRETPIHLDGVEAGEVGTVEVRIPRLDLLHGGYYLTAFLYDHSKPAPTAIDHREHVATFEVLDAERLQHGLVYLPSTWRIERHPARGEDEVLESPA